MFRLILLSIAMIFMFHSQALADETLNELTSIIQSELKQGKDVVRDFSNSEQEMIGSSTITKSVSLQEILKRIQDCEKAESVRDTGKGFINFAFSCRVSQNEISTSEVFVSTEGETPQVISYQEMQFEEKPIDREQLLTTMMMSPALETYHMDNNASPAIKALLVLAKVGAPVCLSFKAAKILSPARKDWQKHYIAGAMISGLTILTSEGIIRTLNSKRGWGLSEAKINLLSSFAGLLSSIAAGAAKELIWDKALGRGQPEFKDALYTAAGGASVSVTVAIPLEKLFGGRRARVSQPFAY